MQRVLFESYYNDNFGSSVDRTNIYRWDQILHKNWSHGTKIVAENIGPRTNFWWDQNLSDSTIDTLYIRLRMYRVSMVAHHRSRVAKTCEGS